MDRWLFPPPQEKKAQASENLKCPALTVAFAESSQYRPLPSILRSISEEQLRGL